MKGKKKILAICGVVMLSAIMMQPFLMMVNADEGTISTLANIPKALHLARGAFNETGKVFYIISGYNDSYSLDDVYWVNISSNTTGVYSDVIPDSGRYQFAFAVDNTTHNVYLIGGYKNTGTATMTNTILAWNWDNKTGWNTGKTVAGVTGIRIAQACYVYSKNQVYIIGGKNSSGNYLNDIRIYAPSNNTCWDTGNNFLHAVAYGDAVYDSKRDLIWVIGGYDGSSLLNKISVLDPDTYSSKDITTLPYELSSFYDAVYDKYDDAILIAGGYTSSGWNSGTNDILKISLSGNSYSDVSASVSIINNLTGVTWMREGCGAYDYADNKYFVATGGDQDDTLLSKVWSLALPVSGNNLPSVSNPSPSDGATDIEVPPSLFSITVSDADGDTMNVTFQENSTTGTWRTFDTNNSVPNGTYRAYNTSWVTEYNTKHWWRVCVNDGTGWTNETYYFTTKNQTFQSFSCGYENVS